MATATRRQPPTGAPTKADDDYVDAGDPGWISRRAAADRAGVHLNTIRNWQATGKLPTRRARLGKREEVRYPVEVLDAVAAEAREARQGPAGPGAALVLHADELWRMVHEAGAQLTEQVARAATLEAELAAERAQAVRTDALHRAEVEQLEAAIARLERRAVDAEARWAGAHAELARIAREATGSGWWPFRRRIIIDIPAGPAELEHPAPPAGDA